MLNCPCANFTESVANSSICAARGRPHGDHIGIVLRRIASEGFGNAFGQPLQAVRFLPITFISASASPSCRRSRPDVGVTGYQHCPDFTVLLACPPDQSNVG
jgi:hypothetical protein